MRIRRAGPFWMISVNSHVKLLLLMAFSTIAFIYVKSWDDHNSALSTPTPARRHRVKTQEVVETDQEVRVEGDDIEVRMYEAPYYDTSFNAKINLFHKDNVLADRVKPTYFEYSPSDGLHHNHKTNSTTNDGDWKTILLWNPFFGEPDYWGQGFGTKMFEYTNCSHTCWTTNDRSTLPYADAVVIHVYNMGPGFQNETIPARGHSNQIFVFFILESPLRSHRGIVNAGFSFYDIFNLTFTFLDDPETDIYVPLGGMVKLDHPRPDYVTSMKTIKSKKSIAAWLVSNCNAPSSRRPYVAEMQKQMDVHIYGNCGNYSCPVGEMQCYIRVIRDYLFYLAYENSYCQDYITEKTWRTLSADWVPVVLGGGKYSQMVTPNSYIDVHNFTSPKELVQYLLYLHDNPAKYQEYFKWKEDYYILQEGDYKARGFCKLCQILNSKNYPYKSQYDPLPYFKGDRYCLKGKEEEKAVHVDYVRNNLK